MPHAHKHLTKEIWHTSLLFTKALVALLKKLYILPVGIFFTTFLDHNIKEFIKFNKKYIYCTLEINYIHKIYTKHI